MNEWVDIPLMLRVLQREVQSLSGGKHAMTFRVNEQLKVFGNQEQFAQCGIEPGLQRHHPYPGGDEYCRELAADAARRAVPDR